MEIQALPFDASPRDYEAQANALLEAYRAGNAGAIAVFKRRHPRFLDDKIVWLPRNVSDDEVRNAGLGLEDARLALARWYDFRDWGALMDHAAAASESGTAVHRFEAAVEAVIHGDTPVLKDLLRDDPELIRERSTRTNYFDPPQHRATLLHYVAANGVEGYRQITPKNAVEVATVLLRAGADPDALADMYGGKSTAMPMLASSSPPAQAGVQDALIETLAAFGASVDAVGDGNWRSPLLTALVFGFKSAAETLVRLGARVDNIAMAAGLGRVEDVKRMLPDAGTESRLRALALAAQLGQMEVVRVLLDSGEDPSRYCPPGTHTHTTPLHQAVWAGHEGTVRLLVERGARLDIRDKIYQGTPLGWAEYGGKAEIAEYLRTCGAEK